MSGSFIIRKWTIFGIVGLHTNEQTIFWTKDLDIITAFKNIEEAKNVLKEIKNVGVVYQ